jgi:hydrogenase maturation protease
VEIRRRILILGLGNPLAGDDSFGAIVVEALARVPLPAADVAAVHTDLLGWIDRFENYERVILVDALLDPDGPAGEVSVLTEAQLASFPDASPSVHQMSPLLALRLFRQLYPGAKTEVVLVALRTREIRIPGCRPPEPSISAAIAAISAFTDNHGSFRDNPFGSV